VALLRSVAERAIRLAGPAATNELLRSLLRDYEHLTYRRLRPLGFEPATIFDIGAYQGRWASATRAVFPDARIVMVEAQPELRPELMDVVSRIGNATVHSCLLAVAEQDSIPFYRMGTGSSIRAERSNASREVLHLPSRTLNQIWQMEQPLETPVFAKLDVQGAELEVLTGGLDALPSIEWLQLECALLDYNEGAPQLREVCNFLSDYGLHATEIVGFSRPKDHVVQVDLLFTRERNVLRPRNFAF
jgi:FkbM family methyltransferase